MLEFAFAWAVLALPLPLLLWWGLPPHRERASALRVPFFADIVAASGVEPGTGAVVHRRRRTQAVLLWLIWLLLVVALMRPNWVGEPIVRTEVARDIMLAIDLSGSMDYRDFPGRDGQPISRHQAVQQVVKAFIAERESDRVGLIVFGDKAYMQLPFTRDLATASTLVDLMAVAMAGPQTALGDAIGLSIHAFESSSIEERILILLTDGNDTASRMTPINAAAIAARNGVEIYTIGIGDPQATGEDRVDFSLLADIAGRTGGEFFNAEDETALAAVYQRIDEATAAEVNTESWRPRQSLVVWPAGAALLIGLATLAGMRFGRQRSSA
ncbi:VWA domain-containing protein [Haliea sp.]|uniref:VWA domain-containing protein n=1 Tax=Haliea sp. TaxID=1932666 RepID=UPI003527912B